MPQAPRCEHCNGEHHGYKCPHEKMRHLQEEANSLARKHLDEQRQRNREDERRHRREEERARTRDELEVERARREQEEREERQAEDQIWKASSQRIRDLKRRAGDLRRDAEGNAEESWIGLRTLLIEADDVAPEEIHPAERADFDAFTDKLRSRFKQAEKALGHDVRHGLRRWLRLERQKSKIVNDAAKVMRALDAEAMSSEEVMQVIAETRGRLDELRSASPRPLPESIEGLYESAEQSSKETVVNGVSEDRQRRDLAEAAWRYLSGRTPPTVPGPRSPSPGAAKKILVWTAGIGVLFVAIPLVSNFGATVTDALLAFSPIGAGGVVGMTVAAMFGGRARQKEYEDRQAYERDNAEYMRHVILLGAWRDRVQTQIREAERDLELLPEMAKHMTAFEAFQIDPKRGGRIDAFREQHPYLSDRMSELATAMELARERASERGDEDDLEPGDLDDLDDILGDAH